MHRLFEFGDSAQRVNLHFVCEFSFRVHWTVQPSIGSLEIRVFGTELDNLYNWIHRLQIPQSRALN